MPSIAKSLSYTQRMNNCELRALQQTKDFTSPFNYDIDGFNKDWWHRQCNQVNDSITQGTEFLQLLANGAEVGRAETSDSILSPDYLGLNKEVASKEIEFFEIREDVRSQGYGTEFVRRLTERYLELPLIVFSLEEAENFWKRLGWIYYPRKDESPGYRKLFISQKISQS